MTSFQETYLTQKQRGKYAELHRLTDRVKAEGYIPDTQLVLQNIDEEDKGSLSLSSHSEKLAIAYGLMMHSAPEKPIHMPVGI
jgi:hypothetical protein